MIPSSRKEAIELNSTHYFTNKPCKNNHIAKRYTNCGVCEVCLKNSYNYDKEKRKEYEVNNYEKLKEYRIKYRFNNKEKLKQYKKDNAQKINALNVKRHCSKIQRTPKWLTKTDFFEIELIYKEAKQKTNLHKEKYHVDHIIPLNGKYVCGLHVKNNLQIIKASENLIKSNKYI